jgi:hypothetical protein
MEKETRKPTEKKIYSLENYSVTNKLKTLKDAINYFLNNVNNGVECPCCKNYTKQYVRKFNSGMAYGLIKIYIISKNKDYIHVSNEFIKEGISNPIKLEYSKLRYWGLLESKEKEKTVNDEKDNIGYWRITDKGRKFVENKIHIKERIKLINGEFHGFDGNDINIIDALKNKFNYNELMSQK